MASLVEIEQQIKEKRRTEDNVPLSLNRLNPKSSGGVFHPSPVRFWLMTSEVESFSTRIFVTFPDIKCRIRKNKIF